MNCGGDGGGGSSYIIETIGVQRLIQASKLRGDGMHELCHMKLLKLYMFIKTVSLHIRPRTT